MSTSGEEETREPGSELAFKAKRAGASGRGKELKLWVWGRALEELLPGGLRSFWKREATVCAKSLAAYGCWLPGQEPHTCGVRVEVLAGDSDLKGGAGQSACK